MRDQVAGGNNKMVAKWLQELNKLRAEVDILKEAIDRVDKQLTKFENEIVEWEIY